MARADVIERSTSACALDVAVFGNAHPIAVAEEEGQKRRQADNNIIFSPAHDGGWMWRVGVTRASRSAFLPWRF